MTGVRFVLAGTLALTKAELANLFQYRIVMFLYALWEVVNPIVYIVVWSLVAGDGEVGGYRREDFIMYYLVFMLVSHFTISIEVYTFAPLIQQGKLSPRLLRPMHPSWSAAATNIAYKAVSLIMLIPVWIGIFVILRPPFHGDWIGILLFVPAILMATLVSFLAGSAFAMLAFWTTKSFSFWEIWMSLLFLFGGQVAPIAVLPEVARVMAIGLPFRYALGFPVEVVLGRLEPAELLTGFALQGAWTVVAVMVFAVLWRAGIRRYSAVGA